MKADNVLGLVLTDSEICVFSCAGISQITCHTPHLSTSSLTGSMNSGIIEPTPRMTIALCISDQKAPGRTYYLKSSKLVVQLFVTIDRI